VEAATVAIDVLWGSVALGFLGMAALVAWTAPRAAVNRALAAYFAIFGLAVLLGLIGSVFFATDVRMHYNLLLWDSAFTWASMPCYVLFFARALDTPLVRPLRSRIATALLVSSAVAIPILVYSFPAQFLTVRRNAGGDGSFAMGATFAGGPLSPLVHSLLPICLTVGLVASIDALRRAPAGSLRRRRAWSYALAFGAFDVGLGSTIALADFVGIIPSQVRGVLILGAAALGLALVARGLLRDQLFDFDLRVKWTLRRGTLVAAFVVAFLVVAEVVQALVSSTFGILAGLLAAALLFLAKRPLERAADRLADRAMPRTQDTDAYRAARKRDVYRAAVETAADRAALASLADELELSHIETEAIEREASARVSS
jgi:hypothetical protein